MAETIFIENESLRCFVQAGVAFSPGVEFGASGSYVRLNFGCPLPTLERGVARFAEAVRAARAKQ